MSRTAIPEQPVADYAQPPLLRVIVAPSAALPVSPPTPLCR